jgi:hypothetical protein
MIALDLNYASGTIEGGFGDELTREAEATLTACTLEAGGCVSLIVNLPRPDYVPNLDLHVLLELENIGVREREERALTWRTISDLNVHSLSGQTFAGDRCHETQ